LFNIGNGPVDANRQPKTTGLSVSTNQKEQHQRAALSVNWETSILLFICMNDFQKRP